MAGHYSIVLADHHVRFRQEMKRIIEEHPGLEVSGSAGNRFELFELLRQAPPAMVILDVSLPDIRAGEGVRLIKSHYPEVQVLIMVMDQDKEYLSHALAAGAAGILPKQYMAGQIFLAIAAVRQGKIYIPPRFFSDAPPVGKPVRRLELITFDHC